MDYKKKYKDAQKWIESIYSELSHEQQMEAEAFFPELKESEDERIRKRIIHALHGDVLDMEETTKAISWLEKQGEKRKITHEEICKSYGISDIGEFSDGYHTFNELYYYRMLYNAAFFNMLPKEWVHKSKRHHDGEECFGGGWFIVMANLPTGQISNHYELKDWDLFQIPEKEMADEWDGHTPQEATERLHKYLEKQGEQKSIDNLTQQEAMDIAVAKCFNEGEQKPANKVEPKFHEGEWITNGDYTWKIVEVKPLDYILQSQEGNIVDDTISHVDEQFHSFTIKDAKDGDVLACPLPKGCESGEQIFIFKGINSRDYVDNCIEYYCRICDGVFYVNENGYMGTTSSSLYPATKEQRDALFAKMKEAGYEWDTEKKELKKISQRMVSAEAKEALYDKPAWSEEDDNCLSTIIAVFSICSGKSVSKDEWMRCNDFLNSLKGRVQPQKQWKPSDGQMKALHDLNLAGNISYAGQGQVLIELYNDLKKLTE